MHQESDFDAFAHSRVGALALMQIMPYTARTLNRGRRPFRGAHRLNRYAPTIIVKFGQRHLTYLRTHKRVQNDLIRVIAAYNSGPEILATGCANGSSTTRSRFCSSKPYPTCRPACSCACLCAGSSPIYEATDAVSAREPRLSKPSQLAGSNATGQSTAKDGEERPSKSHRTRTAGAFSDQTEPVRSGTPKAIRRQYPGVAGGGAGRRDST